MAFRYIAASLDVPVLGELFLVKGVDVGGDNGVPYVLISGKGHGEEDIVQVRPCGEMSCKRQ